MRFSCSALLWAALCCQLSVISAQQNFGRFGTRFRRSNISLSSPPDASPSPTDSPWISASVASTDDLNSRSIASVDPSSTGRYITRSSTQSSSSTRRTPPPIVGLSTTLTTHSSQNPSTGPYYCDNCTSTSSLAPNSTNPTVTLSATTLSFSLMSSSTTTTPSSNLTITSLSINSISECFSTKQGAATTIFSFIYTSTVTWYGSSEAYTGAEDVTPTPCSAAATTALSIAVSCSGIPSSECTYTTTGRAFGPFAQPTSNETYTFITTAKNPSVYYAGTGVAGYGGGDPQTNDNHLSATGGPATVPNYDGASSSPKPNAPPLQSPPTPTPTDVVVQVRPTEVIIDTLTVANNPASGTTNTVTVGTDVFTVGPSSIVGAGATVTRSAAAVGNVATTTTVNGIGIVVSSAHAIVDGSTFSLGSTPTTQTIQGQTVTISPDGVSVSGVTVPVRLGTAQTQVVVAGGELITAIGQSVVVVDGTSYTYGPGSATVTQVVDDDTVYIGPSGVVVDGTTLGGAAAANSDTQYEIVGGATISEVGASVVVIDGSSWTVGPGTGTTTTVIGGETITIGPSGVEIGTTMTLSYPFGPTSTTTIHPGGTATTATASATAAASQDKKDSAFRVGVRSNAVLALLTTCIAIGVSFVGYIV